MIQKFKAKYHTNKNKLVVIYEFNKWKIKNCIKYRTNKLIRSQLKNPFKIPIIIISFNQLHYLKQLINFLLDRGFTNIVIIDNYSSYPQLLEYFDSLINNDYITIHRLNQNKGHLVFWEDSNLFKIYSRGFYVVTDPDIVPDKNTPDDFIKYFLKLLINTKEVTKVGFSLFLDDIPISNPNADNVKNWENQFWQNKIGNDYLTSIDTTFALYRPEYNRNETDFLKAIRTSPPYTARHGGWYIDPKNLTLEQKFYLETANNSSSWLTDENGNLVNNIFKDHYNNDND